MALNDEQFEKISLMLEQLKPVLDNIKGRSKGFVEDQLSRHEEYGQKMFFSPKQWDWLEDIYTEYVGPMKNLEGNKADNAKLAKNVNPATGAEIDDDIPF